MNFDDEVQQAAANWAHPELMRIWGIVSSPDYENGEPVLREDDIETIADAILEINEAFKASLFSETLDAGHTNGAIAIVLDCLKNGNTTSAIRILEDMLSDESEAE